ncbi:hypothetical protein [Flavobacterium tegetincola]|uniref:hypothetical protein n=1 Tax=Flavobacterium tegetincola TaxID=150172 RepID=UPI0003FBC618|nr:hypothetical protein [Flavobacterium tegetincola]
MANTTGKKFGGRKAGVKNKTQSQTKELLKTILDKEIESLGERLENLEPLERVNAIAKLLPYILPKQTEIRADIKTENAEMTSEQREARIAELLAKAKAM